jgi:histidinol-phosphate aminotransferase
VINPKPNISRLNRCDNVTFDRMGYLRLDKNENIMGFDKKVIADILSNVDGRMISAYPMVYKLYKKVSEWLGIKKDFIYVSAGSDGAIKSVFEAYVANGDEVVVIHPTYAMYYVYSDMFGAKLKKIPFNKDLSLHYEDVITAISLKTKLVCIANPNSPTGTIIEHDKLLKIIDFADKNEALILLDEAYYGYYPTTYLEYIDKFKNLIVTRSFTKAYGLGCARLVLAVASPDIIVNLKKVRPIYEVNSFSVLLGIYVIDHPEIFRKHMALFKEAKEYLINELDKMNIKFLNTHANFILIKAKDRNEAQFVADELKNKKVLVKAGFEEEPLCDYIRVNIGNKEHMRIFIENFFDVLSLIPACRQTGLPISR